MGRDDQYTNSDLNSQMQTLTQMRMADDLHAMRTGRIARPLLTRDMPRGSGHAEYGVRNRGWFFWVMLIVMTYWFILKPLGFTLTKNF